MPVQIGTFPEDPSAAGRAVRETAALDAATLDRSQRASEAGLASLTELNRTATAENIAAQGEAGKTQRQDRASGSAEVMQANAIAAEQMQQAQSQQFQAAQLERRKELELEMTKELTALTESQEKRRLKNERLTQMFNEFGAMAVSGQVSDEVLDDLSAKFGYSRDNFLQQMLINPEELAETSADAALEQAGKINAVVMYVTQSRAARGASNTETMNLRDKFFNDNMKTHTAAENTSSMLFSETNWRAALRRLQSTSPGGEAGFLEDVFGRESARKMFFKDEPRAKFLRDTLSVANVIDHAPGVSGEIKSAMLRVAKGEMTKEELDRLDPLTGKLTQNGFSSLGAFLSTEAAKVRTDTSIAGRKEMFSDALITLGAHSMGLAEKVSHGASVLSLEATIPMAAVQEGLLDAMEGQPFAVQNAMINMVEKVAQLAYREQIGQGHKTVDSAVDPLAQRVTEMLIQSVAKQEIALPEDAQPSGAPAARGPLGPVIDGNEEPVSAIGTGGAVETAPF